ncbi:hypothetical protein Anapl_09600 [Anas platyrhynchos]|uniref:Uncharacterized protein n=1 Tax=Anas platyrhynchos TaxID=8839 RepID=R0LQA1_ANAPL|nr:hypothetical protein Anapl_09600 [Anas platyrhynchos]
MARRWLCGTRPRSSACRPTSGPSWQGGKTAPEDPGGGGREKNYFCVVAAPWTEGKSPAQPAAVDETPPDITTSSAGTAARGQTHVQLVSKPVCRGPGHPAGSGQASPEFSPEALILPGAEQLELLPCASAFWQVFSTNRIGPLL